MASQVFDTTTVSLWTQLTDTLADRRARFSAWQAKRAYRARIARELNTCTDRELWDLGFERHDIPAVVNGSYRR